MSHAVNIPLDVFQVLEEEYVALYGTPTNADETVYLPDNSKPGEFRSVNAALNWDFHPTHIRDAASLASELIFVRNRKTDPAPGLADVNPDESAQLNLLTYMCKQLGDVALQELAAALNNEDQLKATVAKVLNQLVIDKNFFDERRFTFDRLSAKSKALIDSEIPLAKLDQNELAHFNRTLLEDAFPDYVEKIAEIRLAAVYRRLHHKKPSEKPAALCFSGGGIRSGTFALGLLQGLARHKLLDKFHYLSTVSGGGYMGSWLAAWIHRHGSGLSGVTDELANSNPRTKVDPDPLPIRYLRRYSNFITPHVGLLSADTWTFIGIYLRNLFLNWIVFIPLLLSILMLPRLILALTLAQPAQANQWSRRITLLGNEYTIFGRHFFLIGGFLLTSWALAYITINRPTLREQLRQYSKFWRSRSTQRSFLVWCLLPLTAAAFCLTTYWAWSSERSGTKDVYLFLFFGLGVVSLAWLISSLILRRWRRILSFGFRKSVLSIDLVGLLVAGTLGGLVLWLITLILAPINVEGLESCSAAGSNWQQISWNTEIYAAYAVPIFMLVFLLGATLFIGLTSFSPRFDDEDREWAARQSAWVLIVILGWSIFSTLVIFGPIALLSSPKILASVGGVSGLLAALLGRSEKTPGAPKSPNQEGNGNGGIMGAIMGKLLPLLALIFLAGLIVSLSLATTGIIQQLALLADGNPPRPISSWIAKSPPGFECYVDYIYNNLAGQDRFVAAKVAHMNVLHHTSFWFILMLGLALFAFAIWGASKRINLNIFSLHGGYRNRLIRAFLGASRPDRERKPNPFTGFDPADNLSLHELRAGLFVEADFPNPVILTDALLNARKSDGLQPQAQALAKLASGSTQDGKETMVQVQKDDSMVQRNGSTVSAAIVSQYLFEKNLLTNVTKVPDKLTRSTRLIAALRRDLNGALQDPQFHEFAAKSPLGKVMNGGDNHIAQNRQALEAAFPGLIRPRQHDERYRLMPVINTTLNLVGGDNLAWQQRKAEPFTVTPLHAGCFRLGYRDSRHYGGPGGISIGTSAAISGAAASSNMGYYTTSPVLSLLLTFFNVRLGWWLGNPGPAGRDTFSLRAPRYSVKPILEEAFGLTDDRNEYVYLTDGGHFENLGFYEMVLRRCHVIVVSDAAADPDYHFGDLGNAIRKVRIDLGVPIEFTAMPIFACPPEAPEKGMYWAAGRIRYSCIDGGDVQDGLLLYIKPAIYGNEPRDVLEYKKSHTTFPHQSTADQFFDEPQFESYRVLGSHVMDQICGEQPKPLGLYEMLRKALDQLTENPDGPSPDQKLKPWKEAWLSKLIDSTEK